MRAQKSNRPDTHTLTGGVGVVDDFDTFDRNYYFELGPERLLILLLCIRIKLAISTTKYFSAIRGNQVVAPGRRHIRLQQHDRLAHQQESTTLKKRPTTEIGADKKRTKLRKHHEISTSNSAANRRSSRRHQIHVEDDDEPTFAPHIFLRRVRKFHFWVVIERANVYI